MFFTCFHTLRWVGPLLTLSIEPDTNRRRPRPLKTLVVRFAGSRVVRVNIHLIRRSSF